MRRGKAAVFFGPGKPFELRELPLPEVEPDAVLIRVALANVCGSDLHFWRGDAPLRLPDDGWIYGHEMTGRVARLGSRVKTDSMGRPLREGDRVAYRSEEHTSELQSLRHLVCRLLLEKKKKKTRRHNQLM